MAGNFRLLGFVHACTIGAISGSGGNFDKLFMLKKKVVVCYFSPPLYCLPLTSASVYPFSQLCLQDGTVAAFDLEGEGSNDKHSPARQERRVARHPLHQSYLLLYGKFRVAWGRHQKWLHLALLHDCIPSSHALEWRIWVSLLTRRDVRIFLSVGLNII